MKLNTAKKLTAGALALSMMFAMATPMAFADDGDKTTYKDMSTVTIKKVYEVTNTGTTSPKESFTFNIERVSVTDAAAGVDETNCPVPTVSAVSYEKGEAGSASKTKDITVTLPTNYTSVGVYTYKITENNNGTAGVTYHGDDIILKVTVIEQNGKIRVAAVHTETDEKDAKKDDFPNFYSAGTLAVSKVVTGNMGDQTKKFDVNVTFKAPAGKTVREAISYSEDGVAKTIPADSTAWKTDDEGNVTATVKISVKHGDTVTFNNIPYDVTYTVEEADYTKEADGGYDEPDYNFSDTAKKIDSANDTVTITNNKGRNVDTGVILDNAPYILMLAVVAGGAMTLVIKKRREEE